VVILVNHLVSTFVILSFVGVGVGQRENYVNLVLAPQDLILQRFNHIFAALLHLSKLQFLKALT
jgi:hypothetical protein